MARLTFDSKAAEQQFALRRVPPYALVNIVFSGATCGATKHEGCAEMGLGAHADPATGAFGGTPYGATK
eukprot:4859072-Pyramimonas_sp.AAC.1